MLSCQSGFSLKISPPHRRFRKSPTGWIRTGPSRSSFRPRYTEQALDTISRSHVVLPVLLGPNRKKEWLGRERSRAYMKGILQWKMPAAYADGAARGAVTPGSYHRGSMTSHDGADP